MASIIKTGGGDIDVSSSPIYAAQFGDGSTYGLQIELNGDMYRYVPKNVIQNGGLISGNNAYILPWLLNADNLKTFSENATTADLSNTSFASWLNKNNVDTNGYMYKESTIPLDSSVAALTKSGLKGDLNGLKVIDGNVVVGLTGGAGNRYWNSAGEVHDPSIKYTSLLGDWTGGLADDLGISSALFSVAQPINEFFNTDVGKAIKVAALAASLGATSATDAAAEEAAKQAAADEAAKQSAESAIDYYAGNYAGTDAASFLTPEQLAAYGSAAAPVTAEAITNEIAGTQPSATIPQTTPETTVAPESQIDYTAGNYSGTEAASFLTPDELAFYGPITDAEMTAAKEAAASTGWTFKQALDAARAGLLINALTGDPLHLSGTPSGNVGGGSTGFDIVPVPSEWKSPTYTTSPVTNVTFEDLFPGVSLQGTQWAGLQNAQPNMTFNDIFSAGLQSTPMGTPVNIADIVGNIVGQSAKS